MISKLGLGTLVLFGSLYARTAAESLRSPEEFQFLKKMDENKRICYQFWDASHTRYDICDCLDEGFLPRDTHIDSVYIHDNTEQRKSFEELGENRYLFDYLFKLQDLLEKREEHLQKNGTQQQKESPKESTDPQKRLYGNGDEDTQVLQRVTFKKYL